VIASISQAAQFGKLLNVDAIVTGQIDNLYTETRLKQEGLLGMGRKKVVLTSTVTVTSQLISTATAKILAAPSFTCTETTELGSEVQVSGASRFPIPRIPGTGNPMEINGQTGSITTTKSAMDPYIRKVLGDAIDKVGRQLVSVAPSIPPLELARAAAPNIPPRDRGSERVAASEPVVTAAAAPVVTATSAEYIALDDEIGNVLKVDGETLTFSLAPNTTVNVGDKLEVHKVEFMPDPRSGKTIPVGEKVGTIQVTEVRSAYSRGTFTGNDIQPKMRVIALMKATTPQKMRARTPSAKPANPTVASPATASSSSPIQPPATKRVTESVKPPPKAATPATKTIPTP